MRLKNIFFLFIPFIFWILLIVACFGCTYHLTNLHFININKVDIIGKLTYTMEKEIVMNISDLVEGSFFSVDAKNINKKILELPWIRKSDVTRKWPDRLEIKVEEHKPILFWENKGIVTESLELIPIVNYEIVDNSVAKLPKVYGGKSSDTLTMLETYLVIISKLSTLGLQVVKLEIEPDGGWQTVLETGLKLKFGKRDLLTRLDHFLIAYKYKLSKLINDSKKDKKIAYIDLRYLNGVAVGK